MRISSIKGDDGYGNFKRSRIEAEKIVAYLNDIELSPFVSADEEKGEIIIIKRRDGKIIFDNNGNAMYETKKGNVKIVITKKKNRTTYSQKRLKKDIIIKAGTIMKIAPLKTERFGNCHYDCAIGLTDNSCGFFNYCVDDDELDEWFEDVE